MSVIDESTKKKYYVKMFGFIIFMAISFAIHDVEPKYPASLKIQLLSLQTDIDVIEFQKDFELMKRARSIASEFIEVKLYLCLKEYQRRIMNSSESIKELFDFEDDVIHHALLVEREFWFKLARWWQTFNKIYQPLIDEYCMSFSVEDKKVLVKQKISSDFIKQFEAKGLFLFQSDKPSLIFHEVLLSRSIAEYKLSCYEPNILNIIEVEQSGDSNFKFYQRLLRRFAEIAYDNRRNNIRPVRGSYGLEVDFDDIRDESIDSFYSYMLD